MKTLHLALTKRALITVEVKYAYTEMVAKDQNITMPPFVIMTGDCSLKRIPAEGLCMECKDITHLCWPIWKSFLLGIH